MTRLLKRGTMSKRGFSTAIGWNLIGSVTRVVITIGCQLALLRLLGPVPAGEFALFLFIVGIGSILSEGGMMVVLARASTLTAQLLRASLFLILCYSTLTALVLIAFTGPFMRLFQLPPSAWYVPIAAALNVIPLGLSSVPISALKQQYRARDIQLVQLGGYLVGYALVALPLAFWFKSVGVLVTAFSVQTIVGLIAAMIVSRCPVVPHWRGSRAIRSMSSRALLVNIAGYVNESAPNVFIAHSLGPHPVGLYSTSFNLLRMPTDVIVSALHGPLLVSTARDDDGTASRERFLSTLNVLATTVLAIYVVAFFCGQEIVLPLLGSKWVDAGPVLSIVALIMAVRLISNISGAVVWGQGRLMLDFGAQMASVIVLLGGFLQFRPDDLLGVGWIVLASYIVRVLIQLGAAMRAVRITPWQMLHALIGPAIMTAFVMLPMRWVGSAVASEGRFMSLLSLGAASAVLLALRVAIGMWRSPYAWAALMHGRMVAITRKGVRPASRLITNPAEPDQTIVSIGDRS